MPACRACVGKRHVAAEAAWQTGGASAYGANPGNSSEMGTWYHYLTIGRVGPRANGNPNFPPADLVDKVSRHGRRP